MFLFCLYSNVFQQRKLMQLCSKLSAKCCQAVVYSINRYSVFLFMNQAWKEQLQFVISVTLALVSVAKILGHFGGLIRGKE